MKIIIDSIKRVVGTEVDFTITFDKEERNHILKGFITFTECDQHGDPLVSNIRNYLEKFYAPLENSEGNIKSWPPV